MAETGDLDTLALELEEARYDPTALVELRERLTRLAAEAPAADPSARARLLRLLTEASTWTGAFGAAYDAVTELLRIDGLDHELRDSARLAFAEAAIRAERHHDALALLARSARPGDGTAGIALATARILQSLDRPGEAVQCLQDLVEREHRPSSALAAALHHLGIALDENGRSSKALDSFTRALSVLEGRHVDWGSSLHNSRSVALLKLGRLDEAAKEADEAISRARSGRNMGDLAVAYMSRGNACQASGQVDLALTFYHEGLVAGGWSTSREHEVILLNNIALCHLTLGQPVLYMRYLLWALDSAEELGEQRAKALALCNLASISDPREARAMLTEAFAIYTALEDRGGQAGALHKLSDAVVKDGYPDDALDLAEEALRIAAEVSEPHLLTVCHGQVGSLRKSRGERLPAWDSYQQALTWSEALRRETNVASVRLHLVDDIDDYASEAADLAAREADGQEGADRHEWLSRLFSVVERTRARVLVDQVGSGPALATEVLSADARLALSAMTEQVRSLRDSPTLREGDDDVRRAIGKELQEARRRLASWEAFLEQSNPRYGALRSTEPVSLSWLESAVPGDVAVIEFVEIGGELASLTYQGGELRLVRHGALSDVQELDKEFRNACSSLDSGARVDELGEQLGARLLQPVLDQLAEREVRHLLVIPAPEAFSVPLDAYRVDGNYLFERFSISYLPSVSVARYLHSDVFLAGNAVILADPDGTLPYARQEAEQIAEILDLFMDRQLLLGPEATKSNLLRLAPNAGIVHIASHAVFVDEAPDFASITLAGGDADPSQNLEVADVMRLQLRSASVVLSGCNTGLGTVDSANEMIGLVRGFLCAGASTVVATRWTVHDASTSEFMRMFYRRLVHDEMRPVEALRSARADHIRLGGYAHPAHWAPFMVFGVPPGWKAAHHAASPETRR